MQLKLMGPVRLEQGTTSCLSRAQGNTKHFRSQALPFPHSPHWKGNPKAYLSRAITLEHPVKCQSRLPGCAEVLSHAPQSKPWLFLSCSGRPLL